MSYPEITLDHELEVQPKLTTTTVTVERVEDSPARMTVTAEIRVGNSPRWMTLWTGEEYSMVGQWTDEDVIARIKQILEQN